MSDLSAFIPATLGPLIGPALEGRPAWETSPGTVLFCDVAGFTPLTEALQSIGREGSEELTRILNRYFSRMIGILDEEGGDVLRFGGDAMTVLFPGTEPTNAVRAAVRMMAAMDEFSAIESRAGTFGISMKIGGAAGDVQLGVVGDDEVGWDYYATGAPLDASAEAEHHAEPGWIVLHPTLPGAGTDLGDGFLRVAVGEAPNGGGESSLPPSPPAESLRRFIAPHLLNRSGADALGEHRVTAVLFTSFAPLPPPGGELHAAMLEIQRTVAGVARRYGGTVNKLDMGDKGAKAVVLFGAPLAIEHKEEMAVRAALELQRSNPLPGLSFRIGLFSAPLFSGPVGSATRRELTVMGDGINMAARLMQASRRGQTLAGESCAQEASGIRFETLAPIRVKGKSGPVAIFEPVEVGDAAFEVTRLIERKKPGQRLRRYLAEGQGPPVAVVGAAGVGKTALLASAADELEVPTTRVMLGPYHRDQPLSVWTPVVRDLLDLPKRCPPEQAVSARDRALASEKAGHRPLFNRLLDLPPEASPSLERLGPRERKELTFAMLERLARRGEPRAVLVDNLHLADPASLELLEIIRSDPIPGWRFVVTLRPGEGDLAVEGYSAIELEPLAAAGVRRFLAEVFEIADVTEALRGWFQERSGGVPAILLALFRAVDAADLIARDEHGVRIDEDRLFKASFPDTLQGLYLARVDRLPAEELEVIRAAAILGQTVSLNVLARVAERGLEDLRPILARLQERGLMAPDSWGQRPYYRFVDGLLRDGIYEALPFAPRRAGHLRAAELLESESAEVPTVWPALAHHFEKAGEEGRARKYARRAGRDAVARFDNQTALRFLEMVCEESSADQEGVEDALALIDIHVGLGRWGDALPILNRLLEMEGELTPSQRVRLHNFMSVDCLQQQDLEGTERELLAALSLAEASEDPALVGRSRLNLVGRLYGPTGRLEQARRELEAALSLPETRDEGSWRAVAAMNLGMVFMAQGRLDDAIAPLELAYRQARRNGGPLVGQVATNLCAVDLERGRFESGVRWGRRAVEVLEAFSSRGLLLVARQGLAQANLSLGNVTAARRQLRAAEAPAVVIGSLSDEGMLQERSMQVEVLRARPGAALRHGRRAMELLRKGGDRRGIGMALVDVTSLLYSMGARAHARSLWGEPWVSDFLSGPVEPLCQGALARLRSWIEALDLPSRGALGSQELTAAEVSERLLWQAEQGAAGNSLESVRELSQQLDDALGRWPQFEHMVRRVRLDLLCRPDEVRLRDQAKSLVRKCIGGVWGLRMLAHLAELEQETAAARTLRRRIRTQLRRIRSESPDWVWSSLSGIPELTPYCETTR